MKKIKKSKKDKYVKCPCCKSEKHRTEMKSAIAEKAKIYKTEYSTIDELKRELYDTFSFDYNNWACDACLDANRAIKGNPNEQNYTWNPHYAFFDSEKTCRNCKNRFVFSKKEKQFWYEELKFWMDAEPVNCVACRKEIRAYKEETKVLSEILKKEETSITFLELEQVIEIYQH